MNKGRLLIHAAIALVLALTAGFLVLSWLQGQGKKVQPAQEQPAQKQVLLAVSTQITPRGTKLTPDKLKLAPYFEQSVPPTSFTDLSALENRIVSVPLGPNEPVTEDKLVPPGTAFGGLETMIAPGKRAVAVRGNKVMGLGGLVLPGARVDVVMTTDDPDKQGQKLSKMVLANVPVLAVGAVAERPNKPGQEASAETYTLEVTPEEAEKLALAGNMGELNLALRSPTDAETVLTSGADLRKNLSSYREEPDPKQTPTQRSATQVEEIRGSKRETNVLGAAQSQPGKVKP